MKKPEALPAIISGTSTTECLSVKISTTVVSRSVFLKSAFVSMLHYHCQSRKQIFNAAQSQYVSATVIGGQTPNCQKARGGGRVLLGESFSSKSVAWWGEVWHCGEKCGRFTAREGGGRGGRHDGFGFAGPIVEKFDCHVHQFANIQPCKDWKTT